MAFTFTAIGRAASPDHFSVRCSGSNAIILVDQDPTKRINLMLFGSKDIMMTGALSIDKSGKMKLSPFAAPQVIEPPGEQITYISGIAPIYSGDTTIQDFGENSKLLLAPLQNMRAFLMSDNAAFIRDFSTHLAQGLKLDLVHVSKGHLDFTEEGELCINVRHAKFVHGTLGKRMSAR